MNKNRRIKFIATTMLMTSLYVAPVILQSGVQIVRAAESDAEALIGRIENLPPVEDLNETHAEEVKSLMTAYSQLKMSDRIAVTNYELLKKDFDALVKKGILTNEDNTILQEQELQKKKQASKNLSDTAVSQEKQYTFKSDGKKGTTIIIRYTTDADGDGKGDAPTRIVLTGPDGTTYPVSNTSVSMSDGDKLKVDLTWTDLYLQMDFSKAEPGKWSLETSQAVTFSSKAFTGTASDVISEDDKKTTKTEEKKPKKKGNKFVALVFFLGLIVGAFFGIKKIISLIKGTPSAPKEDETLLDRVDGPKRLSDEEQLALMREEYKRQQADTGQLDVEEEVIPQRDLTYPTDTFVSRRGPITYDDDDPEDVAPLPNAPTSAPVLELEEEEDTGVLRKEDKPAHQQEEEPHDETADFFDSFNQ